MCGIAGIVGGSLSDSDRAAVARQMTDVISHRGPDGDGHLIDAPLAMGMRRLAIIDLAGGDQPIWNEDRSVGVVFNGEIYNFRALREELASRGHTFATNADTEVIVHLYEERGTALFDRLEGMFAIAVWDVTARKLVLARDRFGKKPLFVGRADDGALLFGSELKSIMQYPAFGRRVDPAAFAELLMHECVPGPRAVLQGVEKLEPGTWMSVNTDSGAEERGTYYQLSYAKHHPPLAYRDAVDELRSRMTEAVTKRLVSDVPLGVFLSGGIDSSAVAALMRAGGATDIKTFSIAFDEESFDESTHARRVAQHLGTDHHEERLTADTMLQLIPSMARWFDEPVADPSILPTYLLSSFTRQHVTVALGGDGGDEVFAGYPTYTAHAMTRGYRRVPGALRRGIIEPLVRALPASDRNFSLEFKAKRFISGATLSLADRHAVWMCASRPEQVRSLLHPDVRAELSWSNDLAASEALLASVRARAAQADARSWVNQVGWQDLARYLRDVVLVKVDRASMAASLEVRAPLLDHTLVDWVATLPANYLYDRRITKRILKDAVRELLPEGIVDRPKKGFGVPLAQWLRGPLRETLLELTSVPRLREQSLFDVAAVQALVGRHLDGSADERKALWPILTFQLWWEEWMRTPQTADTSPLAAAR